MAMLNDQRVYLTIISGVLAINGDDDVDDIDFQWNIWKKQQLSWDSWWDLRDLIMFMAIEWSYHGNIMA